MYSLLLAVIYLAFISLGLPDSLLGSAWPVMHHSFGVPVSYMGIVTVVISACTVVSSLLSDTMTHRFSTRVVTTVSVFLTAVGLIGFSFAGRFFMLLVFAVPYGLGAGAIDAALNNYVALYYNSRHMSWLHCFWGAGAIISPFIMSRALSLSTWNSGYRSVAFIQIAIGTVLLLTFPLWRVNKPAAQTGDGEKHVGLAEALKIRGVPFVLLAFFAYCAAETTAMGWASTFLVEVRHIAEERAAAFASLTFIGITVGRFLGGFLMDKLEDRKMILLGTSVAFCGVLCLLIPTERELVPLCGLVIIGFGYAPIYPCVIHSTPRQFRSGKLRRDHRHPDGQRLCRDDAHAPAVRHRGAGRGLRDHAAFSGRLSGVHGLHGRKDLPHHGKRRIRAFRTEAENSLSKNYICSTATEQRGSARGQDPPRSTITAVQKLDISSFWSEAVF